MIHCNESSIFLLRKAVPDIFPEGEVSIRVSYDEEEYQLERVYWEEYQQELVYWEEFYTLHLL